MIKLGIRHPRKKERKDSPWELVAEKLAAKLENLHLIKM
jgi:hypothetical protein